MENTEPTSNPPEAAPSSTPKTSSKMGPILGIIGVIVATGIIGEVAINKSKTPVTPVTPETGTDNTSTTPPVATSYKDGTYTAQGDYQIHLGPESITLTVTLKNNIVTDAQFEATPKFDESGRFMNMVAQNYKPLVIGKNINDVHLGKISGSSLTPKGFNDAVEKIKQQAKT